MNTLMPNHLSLNPGSAGYSCAALGTGPCEATLESEREEKCFPVYTYLPYFKPMEKVIVNDYMHTHFKLYIHI